MGENEYEEGEKSPAFRFYAADWLSDENTAALTAAQEGFYIRAICHCWKEGTIPADPARLARMLGKGCTEAEARVVQGLFKGSSTKFANSSSKTDRLVHHRLEREREKQRQWREKCRAGGLSSGKSRGSVPKGSSTTLPTTLELPYEVNGNSSFSSSSSIINTNTNTNTGIVGTKLELPFNNPPIQAVEADERKTHDRKPKRSQKAPRYTNFDPLDFVWPPGWTDADRAVFKRWIEYKVRLGSPCLKESYQTQIDHCCEDPKRFRALVERAILGNWVGLNPHLPLEATTSNGVSVGRPKQPWERTVEERNADIDRAFEEDRKRRGLI